MKTNYHTYQGRVYDPISPPTADNDELAKAGYRLMLQHGSPTKPQVKLTIAPQGVLTYGWVIGLFRS